MFINCLFVGCGGFIGSILRYLCSFLRFDDIPFPVVTLGINVLGSFAIMLFTGLALRTLPLDEQMSLFLRVGLCGGFTTFSTFSAETLGLFEQGNYVFGCAYIVLSVLLCICAAYFGEVVSSIGA